MTAANEISDFLTSRRARVAPEDVGFPASGGRRRVAGLRRQEVAILAGISVEYYTQLERGNARGVSDDVLEAITRALRLDDAERCHLYDLVRINASRPARRRPAHQRVRPTVQRVLDAISAPAVLRNGRMDLLAANRPGRALYAPIFDSPAGPPNVARFAFLDPHASDFFVDWESGVNDCVALLRAAAGRDPYDRDLAQLVGELSTRNEGFRTRWATHNVKFHRTGAKRLHHPVVGEITVETESFTLPGDPDQTMTVYTPEPASRSAEALDLLASWASTPAVDRDPARAPHRSLSPQKGASDVDALARGRSTLVETQLSARLELGGPRPPRSIVVVSAGSPGRCGDRGALGSKGPGQVLLDEVGVHRDRGGRARPGGRDHLGAGIRDVAGGPHPRVGWSGRSRRR